MKAERRDSVGFAAARSWAGTDRPEIPEYGEAVIRKATLHALEIDRCAGTVTRFARFVAATGYRTDAERLGWSFVFRGLLAAPAAADLVGHAGRLDWWLGVRGACWHAPVGTGRAEPEPDHPLYPCLMDRCRRVRGLGGRASAHRDRMGARGARRGGSGPLSLGRGRTG